MSRPEHRDGATAPVTRRAALQLAGASGALGALELAMPADAEAATTSPRVERSFDQGWRFHRGHVAGAHTPDFDDEGWRRVELPHDWRIEDLDAGAPGAGDETRDPSLMAFKTRPSLDGSAPDRIGPFDVHASWTPEIRLNLPGGNQGYTVPGVGWYRKAFTVPSALRGRHLELRFDGVMYRCEVFLNGVSVKRNVYGYTSFTVDLTPHLRGGDNVVAVRADNGGATSRWYTGSGIYRHTWLTATGLVRVCHDGVRVTTPTVADTSTVRTSVEVENHRNRAVPVRVRVTVTDPDGRVVARRTSPSRSVPAGGRSGLTVEADVPDTRRWTLERPSLYTAGVEVLSDGEPVDHVRQRFGIRTIAWDARRGFLLNGAKVQLVGGNLHHDHGPLGAVGLERSEERRIAQLKRSGFNAVRIAHGPGSPVLLDVCDRLGMLVMAELFDTWTLPKAPDDYSNDFLEHWRDDLTAWVRRDRNHPSVVSWSIGNEIFGDPTDHGPVLAETLRTLDRTRPVTVGGFTLVTGITGDSSNDPYWTYVDVGDAHYETDLTSQHEAHPDRPMTRSESYGSTMYDDWSFDRTHAWSAGSFVWAAWDYIGEAGIGATMAVPPGTPLDALALTQVLGSVPYPWYSAACGDFDLTGQPRAQHALRRVVLGLSPLEIAVERPSPEGTEQIAPRWTYYDELPSWTWDVPRGRPMRVRIYSSGDEVEVRLNGQVVRSRRLTSADKLATSVDVPRAPGALTVISRSRGAEVARRTLATVGEPAAVRLRPDVQRLTTSRGDRAHVVVEVLDSRGRLVPDAVRKVRVTVSGAGELVGLANGNPHNVASFKGPERWTFHGRALAVVRPQRRAGAVTVRVGSAGLGGDSVTIPVVRQGRR